jgi:hypothetical protein
VSFDDWLLLIARNAELAEKDTDEEGEEVGVAVVDSIVPVTVAPVHKGLFD